MIRLALAVTLALAIAVPASAAGDDGDDGLRDPFRPPGWNAASPATDDFDAGAWRLESTLTSNGRSVAIINGRAVRVGDRIGGARVLRVERGAARLDYNGREFTVRRATTRVRR
jgi:hypothetical protein